MKVGKSILAIPLLVVGFHTTSLSQSLPMSDNFNYISGSDLVGQGGWDNSGLPGGNAIQIASFGLQYTSYPGSGVGLSARFGTGRESMALFFSDPAISSGSVYYSFMIKVDSASQNGSQIVSPIDLSYTEGRGLLYAKDGGTGWKFGIRKASTGVATASYTSGTFSKTDTQVVVVKYTYVGGSGTDDEVRLWVNPDLSGSEPTEDVLITDNSVSDATGLRFLYFPDQASSDSTYFYLDGVRVATSWSDAPLPVQLINFAATSSRFGVDLQWSTASEINNYGFEIERRQVGEESDWQNIGFVQGAGTSNDTRLYSYTDSDVTPGRYAYRIKQIDLSGAFSYYSAAEVEVGLGPKELALEPNYPNPFNPSTNITFTVPMDGHAALKVYNMLGQEVAVLFDEAAVAGRVYQKTFDASTLPTGVYVSRLEFGGQSVMRKMLFVK